MTAKEELEKLDREWANENERHDSIHRLQLVHAGLWILSVAGIVIANFGYWIWEHEKGVQGDAPGAWCIYGGAGILAGSFVFILHTGRRIREYNQAKWDYESRRVQLLQDFYDDAHEASAEAENGRPDN